MTMKETSGLRSAMSSVASRFSKRNGEKTIRFDEMEDGKIKRFHKECNEFTFTFDVVNLIKSFQ